LVLERNRAVNVEVQSFHFHVSSSSGTAFTLVLRYDAKLRGPWPG